MNAEPMQPDRQPQQLDRQLAYLLLRLILGLNIAIHGIARILANPANFAASLLPQFQKTFLPAPFIYAFGLTLPWLEAALGLLLFLGLFTRFALVAGSLLILTLTFGSTLHQDWNAAGAQLTYAIIYAALLAFRHCNSFAADFAIGRPRK